MAGPLPAVTRSRICSKVSPSMELSSILLRASNRISRADFKINTQMMREATASSTGKPSWAPATPTSTPQEENTSER